MIKWFLIVFGVVAALALAVMAVGTMLPREHTAVAERTFDQSPDEIWQRITDVAAFPKWRDDVTAVEILSTAGEPLTWRETWKRGEKVTMRVEESVPPTRHVVAIADRHLPFGGTWTYELTPTGDGCTLRITEEGEVYNPIFRLVSRFFLDQTATMNHYLDRMQASFAG